jgi:hypothetical protein
MSESVDLLISQYETPYPELRKRPPVDTFRVYKSLTPEESLQLASIAIDRIAAGHDRFDTCLISLACLHPGCFAPFHQHMLDLGILSPAVAFWGGDDATTDRLISICQTAFQTQETLQLDDALSALSWIGNTRVQQIFAKWRDSNLAPTSGLFWPPHRYSETAGWELTSDGRRDLFGELAYSLDKPDPSIQHNSSVRISTHVDQKCPWCTSQLNLLFSIDDLSQFIPESKPSPVNVLTCTKCTCFGVIFSQCDLSGSAIWHASNEKSLYHPGDVSEWELLPEHRLVLTGKTHHCMETAEGGIRSQSQIGGLPTWQQDPEYPSCPDCAQRMPFLGQIDMNEVIKYGEGLYYAFYCGNCQVSATIYQQT